MKLQRKLIAEFKSNPSDAVIVAKSLDTVVKAADAGSLALEFIISNGAVDRDNDSIDPNGWQLENFMKSGSVLWAHNQSLPPVAKPIKVWTENGQLKAVAEFTPKALSEFGYMIFEMYRDGFLKATSVGFRPLEYAFNSDRGDFAVDFRKQELLEFSAVPVPANPDAILEAQKSIDLRPLFAWTEKQLDDGGSLYVPRSSLEQIYAIANTKTISVPKSLEGSVSVTPPALAPAGEPAPAPAAEVKSETQAAPAPVADAVCKQCQAKIAEAAAMETKAPATPQQIADAQTVLDDDGLEFDFSDDAQKGSGDDDGLTHDQAKEYLQELLINVTRTANGRGV